MYQQKRLPLFSTPVISIFLSLAVLLAGCSIDTSNENNTPLTSFTEVAKYIREHQQLPVNFITKDEARKLGWEPQKQNLHQVAPGKSIGGDRFGNREGLLPKQKNRIWYEADINYKSGARGADRIVYSNDGLIYMTEDHYKTFTDISQKGP
ncbi:ribonuclease domain-containing protein [Paenibacillus yanchengensis]|uniref:Ribonuclease n=1 Tax=Paenibacillus yanchengensis TaxID=2035833 RepID=A0ABW4YNQ0_9BACL